MYHSTGPSLLLPPCSLGICCLGFYIWLASFHFLSHFAEWSYPLPWLEILFLGWQLPNIHLQPKLKTCISIDYIKTWASTCPKLKPSSSKRTLFLCLVFLLIMIQTATWLSKPETGESSWTHLPPSVSQSCLLTICSFGHAFPSPLPISWLCPIISHLAISAAS